MSSDNPAAVAVRYENIHSSEADLLHHSDDVIEEIFFDDLPFVIPGGRRSGEEHSAFTLRDPALAYAHAKVAAERGARRAYEAGVDLELARQSPCEPRTLIRAARDFAARRPAFAVEAGLLALHWIIEGHGYEITGRDVLDAFSHAMRAAAMSGTSADTRERIKQLVVRSEPDGIVRRVLARGFSDVAT